MTRILLTGGAGFVGAHVIRHLLMNTDWDIVAPYTFQHKGLAPRIESSICDQPGAERLDLVHWDMRTPADPFLMRRLGGCDAIWNVASESHVDRSIEDPVGFTTNNVQLMLNVLEVARQIKPKLFLQMSTDEVYGPAYGDHRHLEWETPVPSNPYSASKAAQEAICIAYWRTYDVPVVITNTMNILGEMQDPEKFLPMVIRNIRDGATTYVHSSPDSTPGSRFYLHARNLADAWLYLTQRVLWTGLRGFGALDPVTSQVEETLQYSDRGLRPLRFHIVGEREVANDDLVRMVGRIMGREPLIEKVSFHASRPGHDLRYALDGGKLASLGWTPPLPLEPSLERTVQWTLKHPEWLQL